MDDEGDFKKARGFLLTYSALVLALWYFGADLTQFKLMGNEIKLHQRTESVWLVLAALNAYFWFRLYQHIPRNGLYFDESMNDLYDTTLVWFGRKIRRRELAQFAKATFASSHTTSEKMKVTWYGGRATGRDTLEEERRHNGPETPELHQLSRGKRTAMNLRVGYKYMEKGEWSQFPTYISLPYEPNAAVTWPVKALTIVIGAFVTPWLTNYIAPLLLGGISTGFALWKWCDMNFFTTTLPHLAQSCAGLTN